MPPPKSPTPPQSQGLPEKKSGLNWNSPVKAPAETSSIPQAVATTFGLGPGRAIMEDDYCVTQIFSSGNRFYIWDEMNDDVFEILHPDLHEIVRLMWQSGLRDIKRKTLVQVGDFAD